MIAAIGADELEHVGVAAFGAAVHDEDRLTPQVCRAAVAGLTGERAHADVGRPGVQPQVTVIAQAWRGDDTGTGHVVSAARTAHSTHHQANYLAAAEVWERRASYRLTITRRHSGTYRPDDFKEPDRRVLRISFLAINLELASIVDARTPRSWTRSSADKDAQDTDAAGGAAAGTGRAGFPWHSP